jgi:hypothetical protein
MNTNDATNQQLELGFNNSLHTKFAPRENRIARANWWFSKMRQTVANAMDWSATAEPRPEQIWIPGAHREVKI